MGKYLNDITIIKPAPNSSRLFRKSFADGSKAILNATVSYEAKGADGKSVLVDAREYNDERFNGTIQLLGGRYNYSRNRWSIVDPADESKTKLLDQSTDYINELVSKCNLRNTIKGHPNYGELITSTNLSDRNDPLFKHTEFRIPLEGGNVNLPTSDNNPKNILLALVFMGRKDVQIGIETKRGLTGTRVRYVVLDENITKEQKKARRDLEEKARAYYAKLKGNNEKLLKVAIALGIVTNLEMHPDAVDELVYSYMKDDVTKLKKTNTTKQANFVDLIEKGGDKIEGYYAFYMGKSKGVIRLQQGSYHAFGKKLGITVSDCVQVMLSDTNGLMSSILEAAAVKAT